MKATGNFFLIFLLMVSLFCLPTLRSNPSAFPIGLYINYHVDRGVDGQWREEYRVLRWVEDLGESVLLIQFNSTQEEALDAVYYVDISTWDILFENGSLTNFLLQPPLWIDPGQWQEGHTGKVPTYATSYFLSKGRIQLLLGTYQCWQASLVAWYPLDDDYQVNDERWFFDLTYGVLYKHTTSILASQQIIHSSTFTRELVSSNLNVYGIISDEQRNMIIINNFLILIVISITTLVIAAFLMHRYYQHQKCHHNVHES